MDFNGKVVLIAGATGGMGREIAKLLSEEDCKLVLLARNTQNLQNLELELKNGKAEIVSKKCDVKERKEISEAINFAHQKFGRIDVAILAVGILTPNPIENFNSSIIREAIEINFMSIVYFLEELLPIMKEQRDGIIAVISTLADKRGVPGWGAYGASKAALSLLLESLRAEALQKYGIKIITIKPGSVKTKMIEKYPRPGAIKADEAARIIVNGIRKEKKVIEFPFSQIIATKLINILPVWAYDKIPIHMQKGEGYPEVEER